MSTTNQKELDEAYKKIEKLEEQVIRLDNACSKQYKVEQLLIAAGFVTQEKIRQAEDLLDSL